MKSYIAHVSSRWLFRALNIESNIARPIIIQIPTQSPGKYTAELPLRRIKLFSFQANSPYVHACNAMQCNAMQCNTMQCNAMQCNAMQCNAMQCNAMQCNAMQFNAMQCRAMRCDAMQCNVMQYKTYKIELFAYLGIYHKIDLHRPMLEILVAGLFYLV